MMKDIHITFSRGRCDKCKKDKYLLLVVDSDPDDPEKTFGICDECLTKMVKQILQNKILGQMIKTLISREVK